MDIFPKFIIEDDALIISKVTFHMNIVTDKTKVKGGGWFRFNREQNSFIFYGDSHDLGKASLEDIKSCVESDKVFRTKSKICSIANDFKFGYDTGSEIIWLN